MGLFFSAIAEAKAVQEVKNVRDKADAMVTNNAG
jgi:hypothetical protein